MGPGAETRTREVTPHLMLDLSWRVIDNAGFAAPEDRAVYAPLLNTYSDRMLPGTDFLASRDKALDAAFRNIALTGGA